VRDERFDGRCRRVGEHGRRLPDGRSDASIDPPPAVDGTSSRVGSADFQEVVGCGGLRWCSPVARRSCGGPSGVYDLDDEAVDQLPSAYIATVVADPEGDDLAPGAGEHVVLRNTLDIRNDLGGWWIEDADGNRLDVGIGTQIDPGEELRVHTACGEDTEQAVFNCLEDGGPRRRRGRPHAPGRRRRRGAPVRLRPRRRLNRGSPQRSLDTWELVRPGGSGVVSSLPHHVVPRTSVTH
jgi:hypothetical protein